MKKRTNKNYLRIVIDDIGVSENDKMLITYSGYFKGNRVLQGQYELDELPKGESEIEEMLIKQIEALVKGYGNGVKH